MPMNKVISSLSDATTVKNTNDDYLGDRLDGLFCAVLAGSFLLGVTSNIHLARYFHCIRNKNLSGELIIFCNILVVLVLLFSYVFYRNTSLDSGTRPEDPHVTICY